jgi:hypothetical protein
LRGSDTEAVQVKAVVDGIFPGVGVGDQLVLFFAIVDVRARAVGAKCCFVLVEEACGLDHRGGIGVTGGGFIAGGARRGEVFGFAGATKCRPVALELGGFGVEWAKPPRAEERGLIGSVHLQSVGKCS